jgi:hypothetical protein
MPPFNKSSIFTLLLKHINFYFAFGGPFAFGEAQFHKIKGREHSGGNGYLNTTGDNVGLSSTCVEFKIFVFEISFGFFLGGWYRGLNSVCHAC